MSAASGPPAAHPVGGSSRSEVGGSSLNLASSPFLVAEVGGSSPTSYNYYELLNAFSAGQLTAQSLVYRPDLTGAAWLPLQSIQALAHALALPFVPLTSAAGSAQRAGVGAADEWFYVGSDGATVLAGSWDALLSAYHSGRLTADCAVWTARMAAWKKLSELEAFTAEAKSQDQTSAADDDSAEEDDDQGDDGEDDEPASAPSASSFAPPDAGARKRKKKRKKAAASSNTSIYVTGLPPDLTDAEAFDFFKKAGVIKEDVLTGERRLRLYTDEQGRRKGDGTITYMFPPSIQLALTLLDGAEIKPGFPVTVSPATFQPASRPPAPSSASSINTNKAKLASTLAKRQKLTTLSWEGTDSLWSPLPPAIPSSTALGLRIVVLKHVFTRSEVLSSPNPDLFFDELTSDIGEELERQCGEVEKMTVYEQSEAGVLIVKFKTVDGAERCMDRMKGRWYGGRQLTVEWFDGTDYGTKETADEMKARLDKFGEELEKGNSADQEHH